MFTRTFEWTVRSGRTGLLITALIGGVSCSDPVEPGPVEREAMPSAAVAVAPPGGAEIEDLLTRVLPASARDGTGALETELRGLLQALERSSPAASRAALTRAEQAFDQYTRSEGLDAGDAVHADIIQLALASVRKQVR